MTSHHRLGPTGLVAAAAFAVAACVAAWMLPAAPPAAPCSLFGFPEPSAWFASEWMSRIANVILIAACAIGMSLLNKRFNFIRSTDTLLPSSFLLMTASMPWLLQGFGSPVLMLAVCLICLAVLFPCYRRANATQEVFVAATFLSAGSLVQMGFLLLVPAFLLAMIVLGIFRIREFLAFLMGLCAPYWVMGAIQFLSYGPEAVNMASLPEFGIVFNNMQQSPNLLMTLINLGISTALGLIFTFNNSVKLFAGNKRLLALNNVISILGIVCALASIFDLSATAVYIPTLYFCVAVQSATICAIGLIRSPLALFIFLLAIYASLFAFSL